MLMHKKLKLNIKDLINRKKTALGAILIAIIVAILILIVSNIVSYEIIVGSIDSGDWLNFFGSILGVLGAFLVANYQFRKEKKRIEKEKQAQVVLGSESYEELGFIPGYDIFDQENSLADIDSLSEMTIRIINAGNSTIYNARVKYDFPNTDNYLDTYSKKSNDTMVFQFIKESSNMRFSLKKNKAKTFQKKDSYYSNEISHLFSGEEAGIQIPTFYLFLLQYWIISLREERNVEEGKDIKKPILKATLSYENYMLEEEKKIFYITFSNMKGENKGGSSEAKVDITLKPYREETFNNKNKE